MRDFKHIKAWQRGLALSIAIHELAETFTRAGYGNLRGQLTRAAEAISANIAEGAGSATNKEFARFLDIAIKSSSETEHHLISARDRRLISQDEWSRLNAELIEVRKMTFSYRRKLLDRGGEGEERALAAAESFEGAESVVSDAERGG